jgi:hypothetical protein
MAMLSRLWPKSIDNQLDCEQILSLKRPRQGRLMKDLYLADYFDALSLSWINTISSIEEFEQIRTFALYREGRPEQHSSKSSPSMQTHTMISFINLISRTLVCLRDLPDTSQQAPSSSSHQTSSSGLRNYLLRYLLELAVSTTDWSPLYFILITLRKLCDENAITRVIFVQVASEALSIFPTTWNLDTIHDLVANLELKGGPKKSSYISSDVGLIQKWQTISWSRDGKSNQTIST